MRFATLLLLLLLLLIGSGCVPQVLPDYDRDPGRAIGYERACGTEVADYLASRVNIPQSLGIASYRHYHLGVAFNGGRRKVSDMAHDRHVWIVMRGANVIKDFRDNQRDVRLDLSSADLSGADLKGADLSGADLKGAILHAANLSGANLSSADLTSANLRGADLSFINLTRGDLHNANLSGANFLCTNLSGANLSSADLTGANLSGVDLTGANLSGADLSGADLTVANLTRANLHDADLLGTKVDSTTIFSGNKCRHALVDRSTAAYMRDSLTLGPRMDLIIVDDLATLRAEFSGVWGVIQLIWVMVFILPYAWFLGKQAMVSQSRAIVDSALVSVEEWVETQSVPTTLMTTDAFREATLLKIRLTANEWRKKFGLDKPTEISIAEALKRYIWNGGERWREGYYFNFWPFVNFMVVGLYNALRLTLLIKTKKLETQEAVRQLPVVFNMGTGFVSWRTAYNLTRYGYWLTLLLILKNTFYFMGSTVQI